MQSMITQVLPKKKMIKHLLHTAHNTTTALLVCMPSYQKNKNLSKSTLTVPGEGNVLGNRLNFLSLGSTVAESKASKLGLLVPSTACCVEITTDLRKRLEFEFQLHFLLVVFINLGKSLYSLTLSLLICETGMPITTSQHCCDYYVSYTPPNTITGQSRQLNNISSLSWS